MRSAAFVCWAVLLAAAPGAAAVELAGPIVPAHLELSGVEYHFDESETTSNPFGLDAAGDVNGDGLEDVVVGSPGADPLGRRDAGSAYVVFGSGGRRALDVDALGSSDGFRIDGPPPALPVEFDENGPVGEGVGASVAGVGDVNGDGLADVALGAPTSSARYRALAGAVYVVFGKRDATPVDLASSEPWGYRIDGDGPFELFGASVAGTGDVNGDGAGDVAASAVTGRTSVVFGRAGTDAQDSRALGEGGYVIDLRGVVPSEDEQPDEFEVSLAGGGDLNADGLADTLVGVPDAGRRRTGSVFAVYGSAGTGPVVARRLGERGVRVNGGRAAAEFGAAVAGAGDMNGDGRDDLAVGDPEQVTGYDPDRDAEDWPPPAGAAYVVLSPDGPGRIDMPGAAGVVRIAGALPGDRAGTAVDGIGDLNGDGRPDLLVGAPTRDRGCRSDVGALYAVYARGPGRVRLRALRRRAGFRLWGPRPYDELGAPVRGMADTTGDGIPDVLAGAASTGEVDHRSPHALLATAARPGVAPAEASPAACLRVRVPRQRLRDVVRRGRLRVGVTVREAGHVDVQVSDPRAGDLKSEFVAARVVRFRRAGSRLVRLRVPPSVRRRIGRRKVARLLLQVTQFGNADDVRNVERRLVLR